MTMVSVKEWDVQYEAASERSILKVDVLEKRASVRISVSQMTQNTFTGCVESMHQGSELLFGTYTKLCRWI